MASALPDYSIALLKPNCWRVPFSISILKHCYYSAATLGGDCPWLAVSAGEYPDRVSGMHLRLFVHLDQICFSVGSCLFMGCCYLVSSSPSYSSSCSVETACQCSFHHSSSLLSVICSSSLSAPWAQRLRFLYARSAATACCHSWSWTSWNTALLVSFFM